MTWIPEQGFREALTMLDVGDVEVIVTMVAEAAEWARVNGYRVVEAVQDGEPIYEIWSGDT